MEQEIIETMPTPYGDMYLKFASEQEAKEVLYKQATYFETAYDINGEQSVAELPCFDEDDEPVFVPNWDMMIDFVGTLYKFTGNEITMDDGTILPEMSMIDGFHVNTRGEMPAELEAYRTNPVTPMRVWA